MKKLGFIALLALIGAVMFGIGMRVNSTSLNAQFYNFPQSGGELALDNYNYSYGRCHNQSVDYTSYEWLYSHLSEEDQDAVDAKYIELLLEIDLSSMTDQQRLDAINDLKDTLVTFIEDSEFVIGTWR